MDGKAINVKNKAKKINSDNLTRSNRNSERKKLWHQNYLTFWVLSYYFRRVYSLYKKNIYAKKPRGLLVIILPILYSFFPLK